MRPSFLVIGTLIVLSGFSSALAAVGDRYLCDVATACPAGVGCVIYNRVDGGGSPFDAARIDDGAVVDATITATVLDLNGWPVVGLPTEDIWLEPSAGTLVCPPGGTSADAPTDASGTTRWREPLHAGGCTLGETTRVCIEGQYYGTPLNVAFVSADRNGDLRIDLADVTLFVAAFAGPWDPCADFNHDDSINLADVVMLISALGAAN